MQKAEVAEWKRIGLAQGSHRDVLCRPFANARNFTQASQEAVDFDDPLKADVPVANGAGEGANGLGACFGHPDAINPGIGEDFRFRKQMRETFGRTELPAKSLHQPAGKPCSTFDRNLLPHNGPRRPFQPVPAARDPKAEISFNSTEQYGIDS